MDLDVSVFREEARNTCVCNLALPDVDILELRQARKVSEAVITDIGTVEVDVL